MELIQLKKDIDTLPPPPHVVTPMGRWGFFTELTLLPGGKIHAIELEPVEGIDVTRFSDLSKEQERLVKAKIGTLLEPEEDQLLGGHYQHLQDGILIHVQKATLRPLFIKHYFKTSAYWNTLIIVEPGAQAKIIETYDGEGETLSNVTEAFLGENASLFHANAQTCKGILLSRKEAALARDATMDWFELNANNGKTYSRVESDLTGDAAKSTINSLYLCNEASFIDFGAKAYHKGEHGQSNLSTRGILAERAKAIYEGILTIGEQAAKSSAFQEEHALILGKDAEVKASPMLYINNNDVRCSHAATTKRPDKEQLFYLQARGLDKEQAKRLMIKAFAWPAIERIPDYARNAVLPLLEPIIDCYASKEGNDA